MHDMFKQRLGRLTALIGTQNAEHHSTLWNKITLKVLDMIQSRINQRDDEPVKRLVDNVMKLLRNAAQMSSLIVFFAVNLMISSNCGSLPNGLQAAEQQKHVLLL